MNAVFYSNSTLKSIETLFFFGFWENLGFGECFFLFRFSLKKHAHCTPTPAVCHLWGPEKLIWRHKMSSIDKAVRDVGEGAGCLEHKKSQI